MLHPFTGFTGEMKKLCWISPSPLSSSPPGTGDSALMIGTMVLMMMII